MTRAGDELRLALPHGAITVVTPARFRADYPASEPFDFGDGPRFAANSVGVEDLAAVEALLRQREIHHRRKDGRLQISAEDGFGVVIEFEAESK